MTLDTIQERLNTYQRASKTDEENAFKEICQEIALAGLARKDFFKQAAFQGGTCLRILHNLRRFSEDLDFALQSPSKEFIWEPFFHAIMTEFHAYGLSCDILERSQASSTVKNAFLKQDSFGKVLNLRYERTRSDKQKVMIKLEIDTNPPLGACFQTTFLSYPYPFSISSYDLSSLFAGKCHALLCRQYVKGRDWYDLIWYINNKIKPNLELLRTSLNQNGPYMGKNLKTSNEWLQHALEKKAQTVDWEAAREDTRQFIPVHEWDSLKLWGLEFFTHLLSKLPE